MSEILQWVQAGSTPFVAFLAYIVWDLKNNHVKHIEASMEKMSKDVAFLKGRQVERDKSHG